MKKYDLIIENEESLNVKTMNGLQTSSRLSNFTKKGLRKFQNDKIYSFNYFGSISNDNFIKNSDVDRTEGVPFDYELNSFKSKRFTSLNYGSLSKEEYKDYISDCEKIVSLYKQDFNFIGTYSYQNMSNTLLDDSGSELIAEKSYFYNWYRITAKGSTNIMDGYIWNQDQQLGVSNLSNMFGKTLDLYFQRTNIENGTYPVLFIQSDDAEGKFLEKIEFSLKANHYFDNSGLLNGKLGKKVFSDKFSISDNCVNEMFGIYLPFDGEGFTRSHNSWPLIKNGYVKNIISDLRSSKKYDVPQSGNSMRSYKSATTVGVNGLQIEKGLRETEDILKELSNCIVVHMAGGGDFNDFGDYSQPVEFSYLYQYGKLIGKLPPVTVSSNMFKMFGDDLIEVASNNFFKSAASPSVFINMNLSVN